MTVPTTVPVLQFKSDKTTGNTSVYAIGRIVAESRALFQNTLRGLIAEGKPIALDLSQVESIDSTGMGGLLSVWLSARKAGCELKYLNPTKRILELLRLTNLDKVFGIE